MDLELLHFQHRFWDGADSLAYSYSSVGVTCSQDSGIVLNVSDDYASTGSTTLPCVRAELSELGPR